MILHDCVKFYPIGISQIISGNGEIVYDRNKRNRSFCFIDLRTPEENEVER